MAMLAPQLLVPSSVIHNCSFFFLKYNYKWVSKKISNILSFVAHSLHASFLRKQKRIIKCLKVIYRELLSAAKEVIQNWWPNFMVVSVLKTTKLMAKCSLYLIFYYTCIFFLYFKLKAHYYFLKRLKSKSLNIYIFLEYNQCTLFIILRVFSVSVGVKI